MSAIYKAGFIDSAAAVADFAELWDGLNWERRADAPRREYWTNVFNRDYTYGRGAGVRTYSSRSEHELITAYNDLLEKELGHRFEGCFLNGYDATREKQDWLGWHEDDDAGIDHAKPIVIITLYGSANAKCRKIAFREKLGVDPVTGKMAYGPVEDILLENGSLVLMPAGFQSTHQHAIPKMSGAWDSRISLTFRALI